MPRSYITAAKARYLSTRLEVKGLLDCCRWLRRGKCNGIVGFEKFVFECCSWWIMTGGVLNYPMVHARFIDMYRQIAAAVKHCRQLRVWFVVNQSIL